MVHQFCFDSPKQLKNKTSQAGSPVTRSYQALLWWRVVMILNKLQSLDTQQQRQLVSKQSWEGRDGGQNSCTKKIKAFAVLNSLVYC